MIVVTVWLVGIRCGRTHRHDELDGGEDGQGDGHGGDGAADQHPGGDPESEGERGVADRGDAARAEQQRA